MGKLLASTSTAALAAGVLDIFMAAAINRAPPKIILQAIASGLLGKAAYGGAWRTAAMGLALQLGISFVIALIYNLSSATAPQLLKRPILFGALYGVAIFLVMNLLVVPLSAAFPKPRMTMEAIFLNVAAMIVFGEIISLTAAAYLNPSK